jgi:hypothetical protein
VSEIEWKSTPPPPEEAAESGARLALITISKGPEWTVRMEATDDAGRKFWTLDIPADLYRGVLTGNTISLYCPQPPKEPK